MKNTITTLLDGCRPEELDGMLNDIDPPMPDEANAENISSLAAQKAGAAKRADHRRIFLAAACIVLVAAMLVSCYVAEKVEYDSAVKFFNLNEFDTDGMSRDDIKRVWRDFTTERFSYDESYQLLENSRDVTTVRGADISILNSTNNHLSFSDTDLWSRVSRRGADYLTNCDVGSGYDSDDKYQTYYENAYIEKYVDGAAVWEAKFKRPFYINGYTVRDGRVLVWGDDMYDTRDCLIHTAVALLDDADGTILWEQTLDSEYSFDEYAEAAFGEYGRIAVLTIACDNRFASSNTLVFRELDDSGRVVTAHDHSMQKHSYIFNSLLTQLSDGWLAEIQYEIGTNDSATMCEPRLVKFNVMGEIVSEWTLSQDDDSTRPEITGAVEYDGRIWLSCELSNTVISLEGMDQRDFSGSGNFADGFSDEWRDAARKHFSSVVYILDPESGTPEQFFSVDGTILVSQLNGREKDFSIDDDGNLVWHIGRIIRCGYSPYTSSFSFYGITRQYDYIFDSGPVHLRQEKTDRFDSFRK